MAVARRFKLPLFIEPFVLLDCTFVDCQEPPEIQCAPAVFEFRSIDDMEQKWCQLTGRPFNVHFLF